MAFKKISTTYNAEANEWAEHYECDHEWEIANLPPCNPGSSVNVLDSGKEYTVGVNGLWGGDDSEAGITIDKFGNAWVPGTMVIGGGNVDDPNALRIFSDGIWLNSPDGICYRIFVNDDGTLGTEEV